MKTTIVGYPRIGSLRELKFAEEKYFRKEITAAELEKAAEKLNCDASDFKRIDAQFGRLGQQWITTAGASSGAWLGLILCVGVTAAVLVRQKKKSDRQVS